MRSPISNRTPRRTGLLLNPGHRQQVARPRRACHPDTATGETDTAALRLPSRSAAPPGFRRHSRPGNTPVAAPSPRRAATTDCAWRAAAPGGNAAAVRPSPPRGAPVEQERAETRVWVGPRGSEGESERGRSCIQYRTHVLVVNYFGVGCAGGRAGGGSRRRRGWPRRPGRRRRRSRHPGRGRCRPSTGETAEARKPRKAWAACADPELAGRRVLGDGG